LDIDPTLGNVDGVGALVRLLVPPRWDSTKQEIEVGTFIRGVEAHYNIEVGTSIAFDEIEFIGGEPVSRVFEYWIAVVEHLVSTLESEGTRLGFLK